MNPKQQNPLFNTENFAMYERRAVNQLAKSIGDDKAEALIRDLLASAGIRQIHNAQDLLMLGEALIARGGVPAIVGRSLKVHAVLKGARSDEQTAHV